MSCQREVCVRTPATKKGVCAQTRGLIDKFNPCPDRSLLQSCLVRRKGRHFIYSSDVACWHGGAPRHRVYCRVMRLMPSHENPQEPTQILQKHQQQQRTPNQHGPWQATIKATRQRREQRPTQPQLERTGSCQPPRSAGCRTTLEGAKSHSLALRPCRSTLPRVAFARRQP